MRRCTAITFGAVIAVLTSCGETDRLTSAAVVTSRVQEPSTDSSSLACPGDNAVAPAEGTPNEVPPLFETNPGAAGWVYGPLSSNEWIRIEPQAVIESDGKRWTVRADDPAVGLPEGLKGLAFNSRTYGFVKSTLDRGGEVVGFVLPATDGYGEAHTLFAIVGTMVEAQCEFEGQLLRGLFDAYDASPDQPTANPATFLDRLVNGDLALRDWANRYAQAALAGPTAEEKWTATPTNQRTITELAPEQVLERYSERTLAVRLPDAWTGTDILICSRTPDGWGPYCSSARSVLPGNHVLLRLAADDSGEAELVAVRGEAPPWREQLVLGRYTVPLVGEAQIAYLDLFDLSRTSDLQSPIVRGAPEVTVRSIAELEAEFGP